MPPGHTYSFNGAAKKLTGINADNVYIREEKYRKEFQQKYQHIIKNAPEGIPECMSYFLEVMRAFIPMMFHGEKMESIEAYMDFGDFHTDYFDKAYHDFCTAYGENDHVFHLEKLGKEELETEMTGCIGKVQALLQDVNRNAPEITEGVSRLYELTWMLDDIFLDKLDTL